MARCEQAANIFAIRDAASLAVIDCKLEAVSQAP